jgi:hypothetical protein
MKALISNPRNALVALVAIGVAGGLHLWSSGTYQPGRERIDALQQRVTALTSSNEEARTSLANIGLDQIEASIEGFQLQATQVEQLLPPEGSRYTQILPLIADGARRRDIWIVSTNPVAASVVEIESGADGQLRRVLTEGYRVEVRGGYHAVAALMTDLLAMDRITVIRNPSMEAIRLDGPQSGAGGSGSRASGWGVRATFEVVGYLTPADFGVEAPTVQPPRTGPRRPSGMPIPPRPSRPNAG